MITLKTYQERALVSLESFLEGTTRKTPEAAFAASVDLGLRTEYAPIPSLPTAPYVCLRIPTGGGKTILGAHIIQVAARTVVGKPYPLTLWLVPTTTIKNQTLDALKDKAHPYRRELDDAFAGQVAIFDIADFASIRPSDIGTRACVVVATVQSLRVQETEGRKVYAHHEDLEQHFAGSVQDLPYLARGDNGKVIASFENLVRLHNPLIITDEAHNATTDLSYDVYERLVPVAIIELTATPDASSSNILVSVAAFELKNEHMIKFPLRLQEHSGEWQKAVSAAVARRAELAKLAVGEPEYIRPIVLIQAQNARGEANVQAVEDYLLDVEKLPKEAVRRATGADRGLDDEDLFAKDCKVEVIITVQALKEGWDCSFAYIFCSTAQVKSDKDIQQLLGRVLRMPYATPRKQEAMSKAYAHVVTDTFGKAAGELTQSLINIGFNPLEAAAAIRRDRQLPLTGGETAPTTSELPKTVVEVTKAPDFSDIPERDRERVKFTPGPGGKGGTVEMFDELDRTTVQAITQAAPEGNKRDALEARVNFHQLATQAAKAPSERGEVFSVPRLYLREGAEQLELLEQGQRLPSFTWDLLATPPDMSSLSIADDAMSFEVFLEGEKVSFKTAKDDAATYLPGFAHDRSLTDLIGWLDQEIRDKNLKQPVIREWIRRCIKSLHEDRGFSEAQLLRGQFVLRRKLREQLALEKEKAYRQGFQQLLEVGDITVPDGPGSDFTYPADMTQYPAISYYQGEYRFKKHYYPQPGDLRWRTPNGSSESEEFSCAMQIDFLEEVEFWVRNLVNRGQFWMPTSRQRTYPDFVAKLADGRLFVIEYKGGDRFTADQEEEKRFVGALWEQRSNGRGLYLMARKRDEKGRDVRQQLLDKIHGR
ncbi:DEAD/DEAH box helicase [Lysobacter sp. HA35]